MTRNANDAYPEGNRHDYARELHEAADDLRRGVERWRLPAETTAEHAERLGAREWVHPVAEFTLASAKSVVELAARLDAIAEEIRAGETVSPRAS
jgi:hypothetical protein